MPPESVNNADQNATRDAARASQGKGTGSDDPNGGNNNESNSGNHQTEKGNRADIGSREKPETFVDSVKEFFGDIADRIGLDGEFGVQDRADRDFSIANLDNAAREAVGDLADWAGLDGEFGTQNRSGRTFSPKNFELAVEEGWEDFKDYIGVDGQRGHQGATDKELEFSWDKLADAWDPKELAEDAWEGIKNVELKDIVNGTFKAGLLAATVLSPLGVVAGVGAYASRGVIAETAGNLGNVVDNAVGGVVSSVYNVTADVMGLTPKTRANIEAVGRTLDLGLDKLTDALANPVGAVRDNVELRGDVGDVLSGNTENLGINLSPRGRDLREEIDEAIVEQTSRPSRSRREDYIKDLELSVRHGTLTAKEARELEEAFDEANPDADREPSRTGNQVEDITIAEGLARIRDETIEQARAAKDQIVADAKEEYARAKDDLEELREAIETAPERAKAEIAAAIEAKEQAIEDAQGQIDQAEQDFTDARVKADEELRDERTKEPNNRREEVERDLYLAERHRIMTPEQAAAALEEFDKENPDARNAPPRGDSSPTDNENQYEYAAYGGPRGGTAEPEGLLGAAREAARGAAEDVMAAAGDRVNELNAQIQYAAGEALEDLEELRDVATAEYEAASETVSSLMGTGREEDTSLAGSIDADVNRGLSGGSTGDGQSLAGQGAPSNTVGNGNGQTWTGQGAPSGNTGVSYVSNSNSDNDQALNNRPTNNTVSDGPNNAANPSYAKYKEAASTFLSIEGLTEGRGEAFIVRMRSEGIPQQDIEDIVIAAGRKRNALIQGSGFSNAEDALDALKASDHPSVHTQKIFDDGQFHIANADLHIASAQSVSAVDELNAARLGKPIDRTGPLTNIANASDNIVLAIGEQKETSFQALQDDTQRRMENDPNYGPQQAAEREEFVKLFAANIVIHGEADVIKIFEGNMSQRRYNMTAEALDSMTADLNFAKAIAQDPSEYPGFETHLAVVATSGLDVEDSVAVLAHSHVQSSETREVFGADTRGEPITPTTTQPAPASDMDVILADFTAPTGITVAESVDVSRYGPPTEVAMAEGVVFDGEVSGDVVAGNGTNGSMPQQDTRAVT